MLDRHHLSFLSSRRRVLGWTAAGLTAWMAGPSWAQKKAAGGTPDARPQVEVWKDVNCGCCNDWIEHMEEHGFSVKAHDTGNNWVRARLGLDRKYGSCHTALVDGYVIEGHVAASEVKRLLSERPEALGLAVPGMPIGSPGMDGPVYGGQRDRYDTLLVDRKGGAKVFERHN